jgi:hypothetical protein
MLPFVLLIALAGVQLGLVAYCGQQAGTAARTAARTEALREPHPDARQAGVEAVSGWLRDDTTVPPLGDDGRTVTARVTVRIPSVMPGLSFFDPVTRSATMPKEDTTP